MPDRRRDDRIAINQECSLYPQGLGEICCTIRDISEVGIAFELAYDEPLYEAIKMGTTITFSYLDEFTYMNENKVYIITRECQVVRKVKSDKTVVVGCTLTADEELKKYITCRKVSSFVEALKHHRK